MTTHKEALKLALEALEYIDLVDNDRDFLQPHECYMVDKAITAIKEALAQPERGLKPRCFSDFQQKHEHDRKCKWCAVEKECKTVMAQPEQEPVAWAMLHDNGDFIDAINQEEHARIEGDYKHALYTTPPQPKEHLEPVAWMDIDEKGFGYGLRYWSEPDNRHEVPLYTTPPQRKPLLIGEESTEFAKWFNAVWLGDGEQGETIPTSGKEYDEYLSQYTLAFGAWMAAKEAAHGIKE